MRALGELRQLACMRIIERHVDASGGHRHFDSRSSLHSARRWHAKKSFDGVDCTQSELRPADNRNCAGAGQHRQGHGYKPNWNDQAHPEKDQGLNHNHHNSSSHGQSKPEINPRLHHRSQMRETEGLRAPRDGLSNALVDLVEEARTSSEGLALAAGLGKDTVGRWIRGETSPHSKSLGKVEDHLSNALKRPIDLRLELAARKRRGYTASPRNRPQRGAEMLLMDYLAELLAADYVRTGPLAGEFAGLSDRRGESYYQQPGSSESLDHKPSYFHTFWGIVGVNHLLLHDRETYAAMTSDAIVRRFDGKIWLTIPLADYEAAPMQSVSRLVRIRHTARGASILFLCRRHCDLASDIAWKLVTELPAITHDGIPEVLAPKREPSLHASAAVLQAILLASQYDRLADRKAFEEQSRPLRDQIEEYLCSEWATSRWAFGALPWWVNAPSLLADIAAYINPTLRSQVAHTLHEEFLPSGRLRGREGDPFDAPGAILDLRTAYAVAQDPELQASERVQRSIRRLSAMNWDDQPLTTADITFLARLIARHS